MNIRYLLELIFGTVIFLFSLVSCVMITNRVTQSFLLNASRNLNIFFLCVHLILLVSFVMILRSLFYRYIKNKDILNGIFTLTSPIIGISSLYMNDTLRALLTHYK